MITSVSQLSDFWNGNCLGGNECWGVNDSELALKLVIEVPSR